MQPFDYGIIGKIARSTPIRVVGAIGLGVAMLGYRLRNLPSRIGIEEYRYSTADFTKSPGGQLIGWNDDSVPSPSGQPLVSSQVSVIERFAVNDEAVFGLAEQVLNVGDELARRGSRGALHYGDGPGHRYGFHTSTVEVPEVLRPAFLARDNHNVFRGLMSCFAPHARQIPSELPDPDFTFDGSEYSFTNERRIQAIEQYNQEQWASNAEVIDHVSLGANGNVAFSHSRRITDERRNLVVWLSMASTLPYHPLDGRVVWALAYHTQRNRMAMFQVGAGEHTFPPVDWMNPYVAGFVFASMFHTYAALMRTTTTPEVPSLLGRDRAQRLRLVYRHYPELLRWRIVGAELDMYAGFGALAREVTGGNVIGPPPPGPSSGPSSGPKIEVLPDESRIVQR